PLSAYLDLTIVQAEQQWREILTRPDLAPGPASGQGRVNHLPVETLLAGAVRLVANVRAGGGDRKFPYPVPELARLFRRKPNAVASKVQNLSGVPGRNRGARTDIELGRLLAASPPALVDLYRTILAAARNLGIGTDRLPDFLGVEHYRGTVVLLGQDELREDDLQAVLERELPALLPEHEPTDSATERAFVQMLRIGQSAFASQVLRNYGGACTFCGFTLGDGLRPTLLRAGHIKPWRDSPDGERTDVANGVAACPTHDAAFDAGLMTLEPAGDHLTVTMSHRLRSATDRIPETARYFAGAGLRRKIVLEPPTVAPSEKYLRWHRERVFTPMHAPGG